jgi:predicted GH43/DUF377 family glycosyl hydrolase
VALITQADLRNVVIFPETFGGRYVRLDRPHSEISPWSIWISYSPDLVHWGDSRVIMKPVTYHWDEMKIGPGAPPFKTDKGWLHIYHGVFKTMSGTVYRLGAALHDLLIRRRSSAFPMGGYCSLRILGRSMAMCPMWSLPAALSRKTMVP